MDEIDRVKVIEDYYRASSALMRIGTTTGLPEELKQLAINASSATVKIIDYINACKVNVKDDGCDYLKDCERTGY
jgi:hypothetical protein